MPQRNTTEMKSSSLVRELRSHKKIGERLTSASSFTSDTRSKFGRFIDSNVIGIFVARGSAIVEANDFVLNLIGYTRAELESGQIQWDKLTPPDYAELDARLMAEALATGHTTPIEKEYFHKNGSRIPILIGGTIISRDPVEWLTFVLDLSNQKAVENELRQSDRLFHLLTDTIPQMVWMTDAAGRFLYVNQQWTDFTGKSLAESVRFKKSAFVHPDDIEHAERIWMAAAENREPFDIECRLRGADGKFRWVLCSATPFQDDSGEVIQWIGSCTQIDSRKKRESAQRFLTGLSRQLRRLQDSKEVVDCAVEAVGNYLQADRATYLEVFTDRSEYRVVSQFDGHTRSNLEFKNVSRFGDAILADLKAGSSICVDSTREDPRTAEFYEKAYAPGKSEALIAIPLIKDGQWVAALAITDNKPRQWEPADAEVAEYILEQTWLALQNFRLIEQIQLGAAQQRAFLRDVFASVTDGKLRLCDSASDLPSVPEYISDQARTDFKDGFRDLRISIERCARSAGFGDDRMQDLVTAATEAATNATKYAGSGNARIYADPNGIIQVWVKDSGKGIDLELVPKATLSRGYTTSGTLGHGMKIMLSTVNRIWLLTGAEIGTTVVLEQDRLAPEPSWLIGR